MRALLEKEFRFEAAHQLLNHDGKCRSPHGHSYRLLVRVLGSVKPGDDSPEEGMVMDFGRIKDWWRSIEGELDHQDLNVTLGRFVGPTTAENIASWILSTMPWTETHSVTLYETATSSATVFA